MSIVVASSESAWIEAQIAPEGCRCAPAAPMEAQRLPETRDAGIERLAEEIARRA